MLAGELLNLRGIVRSFGRLLTRTPTPPASCCALLPSAAGVDWVLAGAPHRDPQCRVLLVGPCHPEKTHLNEHTLRKSLKGEHILLWRRPATTVAIFNIIRFNCLNLVSFNSWRSGS